MAGIIYQAAAILCYLKLRRMNLKVAVCSLPAEGRLVVSSGSQLARRQEGGRRQDIRYK